MSDERLREAYEQILSRRPAGSRISCVSPDELLDLAEQQLTRSRRLEVLDHVIGCGACREDFELLRAIREARTVLEREGD